MSLPMKVTEYVKIKIIFDDYYFDDFCMFKSRIYNMRLSDAST